MSEPVLYQLRFSHFNEKGRWILDHKGLAHRRVSVPVGLHIGRSLLLRGKGTLPILVTDAGRFTDSADIAAELERTHPEPPLYPADEAERRRALELEQWLGRELGPAIRSALFADLFGGREQATAAMYQGLSSTTQAVQGALYPLTSSLGRRTVPARQQDRERYQRETLDAIERIESELRPSGYLAGDGFSVADLTAASLLFPLVAPSQFEYECPDPWPAGWQQFRDEHRGRPAWAYAEQMYARHRGTSAEI
jgi:glutathione S-transferase